MTLDGGRGSPGIPSRASLEGLVLVLTSRCNMSCRYCYQNEKSSGRMSWETARRAIDALLRSEVPSLDLDLWGGEPLLEMPLMRRIVEYVETSVPAGKTVSLSITTNGILLDDEVVDLLTDHRITTRLSFDGAPAAQAHRDRSSFATLDRALRNWRKRYPGSFEELLSIAITVHPDNVPALPASIRYFLDLGVATVTMGPILTHSPGWDPRSIDELDRSLRGVWEASVAHYRRTGKIPVAMFRGARAARPPGSPRAARHAATRSRPMCGVTAGTKPVVDPRGEAYGCMTFVDSYQRWTTRFLRESLEPLRLGPFDDRGLDGRLAAFPAALRRTRLFHGKERKHSSYGRCAECPFLERCSICPVSIAHIPGNDDPHRVPDFPCAFQRVAGKYARRFEDLIGPVEALLGSGMRERKRAFLERLRPPRAGREAPG